MAFNIGAIIGEIIFEDKYSKPLNDAANSAEKFESKARKSFASANESINKTNKSISGLSDTVAQFAKTAAAAGIAAAFKSISDAGGKLESTRISFEVMLGSAEKAKDVMKLLNAEANKSPFSTEQYLQAGKNLLAFGIEADKLKESLKSIGDIAAGTGKDFNELAVIYGKAATAGVIQAEDLNQLTEAGIPIIKQFAAQFGVAESQIKKMGSEGKIHFSDLEEAFRQMSGEGGQFFDMMKKQSESWDGMWSTIRGTAMSFISDFGDRLNNFLKPALKAVTDTVVAAMDYWNGLSDTTKDIIVAIVALTAATVAFALILPTLITLIKGVGLALTTAFVANPIGLIITGIVVVLAALAAVAIKVTKEWDTFAAHFKPITVLFDRIKASANAIGDAFVNMFAKINTGGKGTFGKLIGEMDILATTIKALTTPIVIITSAFNAFINIVSIAASAVAANVGKMITVLKEFGKFVYENGGSLIHMGIAIYSGGAESLEKSISDLADGFAGTGDKIVAEGRNFADEAIATIRGIYTKVENETKGPIRVEPEVSVNPKEIKSGDVQKIAGNIGPKVSQTILEQIAKDGVIIAGVNKLGKSIGGTFGKALTTSAGQIASGIKDIADGMIQMLNAVAQKAQAQAQRMGKMVDIFSTISLKAMKKQQEAELAQLENVENEKIKIIQDSMIARRALLDEEYAAKKSKLDAEFEENLARERLDYEMKLMMIEQESSDEEQARVNRALMEEDWRLYEEELRRQHNERLLGIDAEKDERIKTDVESTNAAIELAEQEKTAKIEAEKKRQQQIEADHAKKTAFIQYGLELWAFQASKAAAVASAGLSYAQSIMSAVQGGAQLAATFPPFTIPAGIALTGMLIGMATTSYHASLNAIQMQQPLPPPTLFAEQGGVISGPRHSQGGVLVNAEGGEAILKRDTTSSLDNFLSNVSSMQGNGTSISVTIQPGAFQVLGSLDRAATEKLGNIVSAYVAEKIERKMA